MPSAQRVFLPLLADQFPEHLKRYEASYAAGAYLKGKYPERIRGLVDRIRSRVGIPLRDLASMPMPMPQAQAGQMSLFC